jgi:hypothetical protein
MRSLFIDSANSPPSRAEGMYVLAQMTTAVVTLNLLHEIGIPRSRLDVKSVGRLIFVTLKRWPARPSTDSRSFAHFVSAQSGTLGLLTWMARSSARTRSNAASSGRMIVDMVALAAARLPTAVRLKERKPDLPRERKRTDEDQCAADAERSEPKRNSAIATEDSANGLGDTQKDEADTQNEGHHTSPFVHGVTPWAMRSAAPALSAATTTKDR